MHKIIFSNGDYVKARKWSGHPFLGIYQNMYEDGSHCILDVESGRRFNSHKDDVRLATKAEEIEINRILKTNETNIHTLLRKPTTIASKIKTFQEKELEEALAEIV